MAQQVVKQPSCRGAEMLLGLRDGRVFDRTERVFESDDLPRPGRYPHPAESMNRTGGSLVDTV